MPAVNKVVATWSGWSDRFRAEAVARGRAGLTIHCADDRGDLLRHLAGADAAIVGPWDAGLLAAAPRLRWVQAASGGVEGYLFPEFVASPVPFTCLKPVFGTIAAEHALASMLIFARRYHHALARPLTPWDDAYGSGGDAVELAGKTAGIVGFGTMGRALAARARAFDMKVTAVARNPREAPPEVDLLVTPERLSEVLAASDYVVNCVPSTRETRNLVDAEFLAAMKPCAFLIDCSGRRGVFDFDALVRAVEEGWIAGVSLQPGAGEGVPPAGSPFWKRDNVLVSPFRTTSHEGNERAVGLFFDNLERLEQGRPLLGLVDKQAGY